jgi:hypothetical protein
MQHPYAFGRYDYGPPPSVTAMYTPQDCSDPYLVSHPAFHAPLAYMQQVPPSHLGEVDIHASNRRLAPQAHHFNSASVRQHSSVAPDSAKNNSNPVPLPDVTHTPEASGCRQSSAIASGRGSLKRIRMSGSDGRGSQFVEMNVPNQPANAIALLPPLTETSAFRHISKNHDEVTALRRRRHKLDKLVTGKPVVAAAEKANMLSQPPVALVNDGSDLHHMQQLAPCSCKWTRSSYEQVLAQADALVLSSIVEGKSKCGNQLDSTDASMAPLIKYFAEPAADSAVSFALKLQKQDSSPEVVQEFISAVLSLLQREMHLLNQAMTSCRSSSHNFRVAFENQLKQAMQLINAKTQIPEDFYARIHPDANSAGEAAGKDHKKLLWEIFHQKVSDIVVAKNGLDVVADGTLLYASFSLPPHIIFVMSLFLVHARVNLTDSSRHEDPPQDGEISTICCFKCERDTGSVYIR